MFWVKSRDGGVGFLGLGGRKGRFGGCEKSRISLRLNTNMLSLKAGTLCTQLPRHEGLKEGG